MVFAALLVFVNFFGVIMLAAVTGIKPDRFFVTKKALSKRIDMLQAELMEERGDHARLKKAIEAWNAQNPTGKPKLAKHLDKFTPDYLKQLGLSQPCTRNDIQHAFHRLAKVAHPDKGGSAAAFVKLKKARDAALAAVGQ